MTGHILEIKGTVQCYSKKDTIKNMLIRRNQDVEFGLYILHQSDVE